MKKFRKDTNVVDFRNEKATKDSESNVNVEDDANANQVSDVYQTPADFTSSDFKRVDDDEEDNIYANDVLNFGCNSTSVTPVFKEPPPLPPKPKNIAWRLSTNLSYNIHNSINNNNNSSSKINNGSNNNNDSNNINDSESSHKSIYFDQPTSSFV